jgi:hypothetical protein
MTFSYLASFDLKDPRNNFTTIQLATSGHTTISVNLASGAVASDVPSASVQTTVFCHARVGLGYTIGEDRDGSTPMALTHSNTSLGDVTHNHLRDAATSAGWGGTAGDIVFGYDEDTLQYTLSYSSTYTVTFGSINTARLYGFNTTTLSGSSSYTSTGVPWGVIRPVLSAVSLPSTNYEPEGISNQAVSGGGAVMGLSRSTAPIYRDWVQQYETKELTLRLNAALADHPFTHQELFEAVRTGLPFVVLSGFGADDGTHDHEVFYLRAEGSAFKPERATDANDAQFHVSYKAVVAGYLPPEGG